MNCLKDDNILSAGGVWDGCSLDIVAHSDTPEPVYAPPSLWIEQSAVDLIDYAGAKPSSDMDLSSHLESGSTVSKSSPRITDFLKHHFIPEHVALKRSAGRAHFHAILKCIISPEDVGAVFGPEGTHGTRKMPQYVDWPYIGSMRLCDVDAEAVQRLTSAALERGSSIQTVTHIRNVVRSIFSHAIRIGCFGGGNPATLVNLPAMSHRQAHSFSVSQLRLLVPAMQYPERELALFAVLAEMSVAEICGLQWKYVNLSNSTMVLENEIIPPPALWPSESKVIEAN